MLVTLTLACRRAFHRKSNAVVTFGRRTAALGLPRLGQEAWADQESRNADKSRVASAGSGIPHSPLSLRKEDAIRCPRRLYLFSTERGVAPKRERQWYEY